jgi:hypothetical protein
MALGGTAWALEQTAKGLRAGQRRCEAGSAALAAKRRQATENADDLLAACRRSKEQAAAAAKAVDGEAVPGDA